MICLNKASQIGFIMALAIGLGCGYRNAAGYSTAGTNYYYLSGSLDFFPATIDLFSAGVFEPGLNSGKRSSPPPLTGRALQEGNSAKSDSMPDVLVLIASLSIGLFLLALSVLLLIQIRKRQAIAAKLSVLEEERNVLFNNAPCGYHTLDRHGVIINANNTLLSWLGYEKTEMLGRLKFGDIISGGVENGAEKWMHMSKSKSGRIDVTLLKKNGELLPVILSVIDTGNLPVAADQRLFATIDNRRCREALDRIKSLDQELEAFSYSISHDLRAPLRSIDGYSRMLEEDYASRLDDEGRRVLNVVMNNARRMGKLIDDLLDFGRLGRKALQKSHVNMTGIVESILQELKAHVPGRRIQISVEELIPASADADMLRQVWHNLLENAFKFTGKKENAIITVRSYKLEQNEVCYEVKDNGVGFDMQYGAKLFGIFQRLHKMQDFSGTGVGLAIVKRIITRHGGRVWAESALNDGATFYFTLPTDEENT